MKGIGHYGNSIGVPTVGGEVYFEPAYEQNCLVNAMCVGLARRERLIRSAAAGVGNRLVLLGARTGRDGIGGASVLASAELSDEDESKRPTVQIGDPFEESKLVECCLELLERELLASLQDLGAAGLSSSSSEMASKGEVGLDIDVSRVPLREADMEPFEIMISESQERMLCVVEPERLDDVLALCERWDVRATEIGEVTDTQHAARVRRRRAGRRHAGRGARGRRARSTTSSPRSRPSRSTRIRRARLGAGAARRGDAARAARARPTSPRSASSSSSTTRSSARARSGGPQSADAAVLVLEPDGGTGALAVTIDGNGRRVACDPYTGAVEAVLECARNLACVGAEPLGLTNCLNFGNPEKPHIAWQLTRAVEGLRDACLALGVPVVGGNVSLYNEGAEGPIYPTPIVGMVGKLPEAGARAARRLRRGGPRHRADRDVRAGARGVGAREAARAAVAARCRRSTSRRTPTRSCACGRRFAAARLATPTTSRRAGSPCALAECCIVGGLGASVTVDDGEAGLFGEGPGGVIVAGPRDAVESPRRAHVVIGEVGGDVLESRASSASRSRAAPCLRERRSPSAYAAFGRCSPSDLSAR